MFMRTLCTSIIGLLTITILGCGTDVKPSTISSVFSSEAVMDDVSNCLINTPIVNKDDNTVTLTADNDCLISIVKRLENPVDISDIVKSPLSYLGKEVTFTAKVAQYQDGYFDDYGRYIPYQILLQTQSNVVFVVDYYNTQYDGHGVPLIGLEYEFTVTIQHISYQNGGNTVFITASHGVIENKKDTDYGIPQPEPQKHDDEVMLEQVDAE